MGRLPGEVYSALKDDLERYCAACEAHKRQKLEMPHSWASRLVAILKHSSPQRKQTASDGSSGSDHLANSLKV